MPAIDELLHHVAHNGGTALHLAEDRPPRARRQGVLTPLPEPERGARLDVKAMVEEIAPEASWTHFLDAGVADFSYVIDGVGTFQVHVYRRHAGIGAVVRHNPAAQPLEARGLPAMLKGLTRVRGGLVLATGPKGAGKTTTLHAMICEIDARLAAHVVTVEDPIQLVLAPSRIALSQRQVGVHTASVAAGVAEAMAIGADVVYASHLPDAASVSAALAAADRGALVLAAVAAEGVVRGLEDLVEKFERERRPAVWRRLSYALRGATSQVLLPCLGPGGSDAAGKAGAERRRCPAVEMVVNTRGFAAALREGDAEGMRQQLNRSDNAQTLDDALVELIRAGRVRAEDAHDHARDKSRIARARPQR